jgi:hypothetical protein
VGSYQGQTASASGSGLVFYHTTVTETPDVNQRLRFLCRDPGPSQPSNQPAPAPACTLPIVALVHTTSGYGPYTLTQLGGRNYLASSQSFSPDDGEKQCRMCFGTSLADLDNAAVMSGSPGGQQVCLLISQLSVLLSLLSNFLLLRLTTCLVFSG